MLGLELGGEDGKLSTTRTRPPFPRTCHPAVAYVIPPQAGYLRAAGRRPWRA
jgi:hypothetical protein